MSCLASCLLTNSASARLGSYSPATNSDTAQGCWHIIGSYSHYSPAANSDTAHGYWHNFITLRI
jgi:hypothetical protein